MDGYIRVIPRDLFNESSLTHLYGRLIILLGETHDHQAGFDETQVSHFDIVQDPTSGSLTIANLTFRVRGERYRLERTLNSRTRWCLYLGSYEDPDFEEICVFDDEGQFSPEMLRFITEQSQEAVE